MHLRSIISNEQQDMRIIHVIPLYGFSELWILSHTEQLKKKTKGFVIHFVTLYDFLFFVLRQGLCGLGCSGTQYVGDDNVLQFTEVLLQLKGYTTLPGIIMNFWMLNKIQVFITFFTWCWRNGLLGKSNDFLKDQCSVP